MNEFVSFLTNGGIISFVVFIWLSIYFILTIWIFLSKSFLIRKIYNIEKISLSSLLKGDGLHSDSILIKCIQADKSAKLLSVCKSMAEEKATKGLSLLSVISSTSPFIGLFGTIVSILNTFSKLSNAGNVSLSVIAPAISEALVATAIGILVAIPAYSIHILLKRKAYELLLVIQREIDILKLKYSSDFC